MAPGSVGFDAKVIMIPKRQFLFLRHGQTDWNRDGRYQGIADTPLKEVGRAQAHAAAATLAGSRIDRIVTSPMTRALTTAAIVGEALGRPLHIERDLRERNFGSFDGLIVREVKARFGLPADQDSRSILPPDADRWEEIFERVPPVIARWLTEYTDEVLLFVAHGGVFDALHLHLVGPRTGSESRHAAPYAVTPDASGWKFSYVE